MFKRIRLQVEVERLRVQLEDSLKKREGLIEKIQEFQSLTDRFEDEVRIRLTCILIHQPKVWIIVSVTCRHEHS